jgi:hypothetical protein
MAFLYYMVLLDIIFGLCVKFMPWPVYMYSNGDNANFKKISFTSALTTGTVSTS